MKIAIFFISFLVVGTLSLDGLDFESVMKKTDRTFERMINKFTESSCSIICFVYEEVIDFAYLLAEIVLDLWMLFSSLPFIAAFVAFYILKGNDPAPPPNTNQPKKKGKGKGKKVE